MAFALPRLFRRNTPEPIQTRSFDAAMGGRRGSAFMAYGSNATETLAAAAPLRSRARHASANNGYIANGMNAIVAEAVGAGIEPASAHPDTAMRDPLNQEWLAFAKNADVEGRTDMRGFLAQMVLACVVDGESFAVVEGDSDGIQVRVIPAEMVDESKTADLGQGRYIAAGIDTMPVDAAMPTISSPSARLTCSRPAATLSTSLPKMCCTLCALWGRDRCVVYRGLPLSC